MTDTPQALKGRFVALMCGCGILAAAVLSRAAYLQILRDPRLESMARREFSSKVLLRPRRGVIQDRNGEALAVNVEMSSLAANPSKVTNRRTLARLLAKATDIPQQRLYERLKGKREFVWIKRHLNESEMGRLKRYGVIDPTGDLQPGLWLVNESKRVYPHGELAAHLLGSTNLDSEGLEGTELWANSRLEGKLASVSAVKDALGRPAFIDAVAAKDVKDGEPIALTIDASLQFAAEQELRSAVEKHGARGGTVIVMNASDGEILAMANEPTFNPNVKSTSGPGNRRNRALTDGYEPGSTLKAVLLATALSKGMKLTDTLYGEHGSFYVQGKHIGEAEAKEKFDWISLKKMIQVSSNIVAAKLALKVGSESYSSMLADFGFGARSGLGFPGEISGILPPKKRWQPLTLANVGFGQGVLVTPIQMARAYATFFNGGWLVQPTILKTPFAGYKPQPPRRILTQKAADGVVEALKSVTQKDGTGMKAVPEGYEVAGKTGTAQTVDPETGRYSRGHHIASFIGSAVGIDPKLVIFTLVDDPKGVYFASETAAPLFRAVLQAAANRYSMPSRVLASAPNSKNIPRGPAALAISGQKTLTDRIHTSLAKVTEPSENQILEAVPAPAADGSIQWKMPTLTGLSAREAMRLLEGHDFRVEVHGPAWGVIHSQTPEDGKLVANGGVVRLQLEEP